MNRIADRRTYRNEDLVLKVSPHIDPTHWDEGRYEGFLDALCGYREYQKEAIRTALRYMLSQRYADLRALARENFQANEELQSLHGRWEHMAKTLQLPDQLACSLDLATGTGKSFVLYGLAVLMLAEGAVDRVLLLCPSITIETGLIAKFRELATNPDLRDALPIDAKFTVPRIINASETIVDGAVCVENYHAILETVKSSIRDSLRGKGERTLVLNDEAHHVANETGANAKRWKEFLLDPDFGFRYVVGVSGTCYVGNDYFADVVFRYSLRQAIEEHFVKKVEYVAEMPDTNAQEEKWQLIWKRHEKWRKELKSRSIRPLTIIVTRDIKTCRQVAEELEEWVQEWENIKPERAREKVLAVSSHKDHQPNLALLKRVDGAESKVEWIVSVSMLSEGWDVKNVFQIVPHEEKAFNSKLLIAQVLGRGLRRPDNWQGEEPVVTVFNHDAWSSRIKGLVNEILEIERRLTSSIDPSSSYNFTLYNLDYTRIQEVSESQKTGEYNLLEKGYVDLPTQVESEEVTVDFERAVSGEHVKFKTAIVRKTFPAEMVALEIYRRLSDIDMESADAEDPEDRTQYSKRFTLERCEEIVRESLKRANIHSGLITDDNRQKILQALGPLRRKSAKRVIYKLAPHALITLNTKDRPMESCSAAELRRSSKTVFYAPGCEQGLPDEQREFFQEVADPDGGFTGACVEVPNPVDFKTPAYLEIADATPERKFIRALTERENVKCLDAWLKNSHMRFYSLEYAWKKGGHLKRGEFSPDFFIKLAERIFITEIKDDGEINEPSSENIKKYEYALAHFERLNEWLEKEGLSERYQFNMLSPKSFNLFFQKLREGELQGFKSELDVAMLKAGSSM